MVYKKLKTTVGAYLNSRGYTEIMLMNLLTNMETSSAWTMKTYMVVNMISTASIADTVDKAVKWIAIADVEAVIHTMFQKSLLRELFSQ